MKKNQTLNLLSYLQVFLRFQEVAKLLLTCLFTVTTFMEGLRQMIGNTNA